METSSPLIIADSSALISLAITSDQNHLAAAQITEQIASDGGTVVIPCEVFAETVNVLGKKFGHARAIEAVGILLDESVFIVEDSGSDVRQTALDWFAGVAEGVSFTDCVVMAAANASDTTDVFGFDDVFSKNGFQLPHTGKKAA
jgi:predicted nucleic acid-binding protein